MIAHSNTFQDAVAELPALCTRKETASFIRSRVEFVSELIRTGELIAVQRRAKQGSRVLIPRESIRVYLERCAR